MTLSRERDVLGVTLSTARAVNNRFCQQSTVFCQRAIVCSFASIRILTNLTSDVHIFEITLTYPQVSNFIWHVLLYTFPSDPQIGPSSGAWEQSTGQFSLCALMLLQAPKWERPMPTLKLIKIVGSEKLS